MFYFCEYYMNPIAFSLYPLTAKSIFFLNKFKTMLNMWGEMKLFGENK